MSPNDTVSPSTVTPVSLPAKVPGNTLYDLVPLVLFFVLSYYTLSPFCKSVKQKAWILTTMSSLLMTFASLPFLYHYLLGRGSVLFVQDNPPWAGKVLRLFQAYLISDLLVGVIHYRAHVHPLSGWLHHSLYIWIVQLTITHAWSHIFCLCAVMELPTAILALGTISPARFRSDAWFGFTFFLTRIFLHVCFIVAYAKEGNRTILVEGSYIPSVVLACAFPMHAMWFTNYIKGVLRRSKRAQQTIADKAVAITKVAPVPAVQTVNVPTEIPPTSIVARRRRLSRLNSQLSNSVDLTVSSSCSASSSPEPSLDPQPTISKPDSAPAPSPLITIPPSSSSFAPPPFVRRTSLDRAIAKVHAQFVRAQQSRAAMYARERLPAFVAFPDRQVVLDYVGLRGTQSEYNQRERMGHGMEGRHMPIAACG